LDAFAADWVSEERFARAYARGKFRSLGWGRIKITQGLRAKGVSAACVALGLSELDPEEYEAAARARGAKEWEAASGVPAAQRRYKVEQALYQRGFESEWARETAPEREV
jgi:regulatory protein